MAKHRAAKQFDRGVLLCKGKASDAGSLRDFRDDAAMHGVRRLFYPSPERESCLLNEVEQLRDGISAILGVQQGIGKRTLVSKVWRLAEQGFQRMSGRQCAERSDQILNFRIGRLDTDPAAKLLQHIDASAS